MNKILVDLDIDFRSWGKSGKLVSLDLAKNIESVKVREGSAKRSVKLIIMRSLRHKTK